MNVTIPKPEDDPPLQATPSHFHYNQLLIPFLLSFPHSEWQLSTSTFTAPDEELRQRRWLKLCLLAERQFPGQHLTSEREKEDFGRNISDGLWLCHRLVLTGWLQLQDLQIRAPGARLGFISRLTQVSSLSSIDFSISFRNKRIASLFLPMMNAFIWSALL